MFLLVRLKIDIYVMMTCTGSSTGLSLLECVNRQVAIRLCYGVCKDSEDYQDNMPDAWSILHTWFSVASKEQTATLLLKLPYYALAMSQVIEKVSACYLESFAFRPQWATFLCMLKQIG